MEWFILIVVIIVVFVLLARRGERERAAFVARRDEMARGAGIEQAANERAKREAARIEASNAAHVAEVKRIEEQAARGELDVPGWPFGRRKKP